MAKDWSPDSWRDRPIKQQPAWPDLDDLDRALKQIAGYPPLVFAGEARSLQAGLAKVAAGNAFLLQAATAPRSFADFSANRIRDTFRVILQMAVVLTIRWRRAGREGRPHRRAVRQAALADFEMVGDDEIPSFRGHIVNAEGATAAARVPTPSVSCRRTTSRRRPSTSAGFTKGGFAALDRVHAWNQEFVASRALRASATTSCGPGGSIVPSPSCGPRGWTPSQPEPARDRVLHPPRGSAALL